MKPCLGILFCAIVPLACGGSTTQPTGGAPSPATTASDASPSTSSTGPTVTATEPDAGVLPTTGDCNTLDSNAPAVTLQMASDEGDTPAGGFIIAGTYRLVDVTAHMGVGGPHGPLGESVRGRIVVHGSEIDSVLTTSKVTQRNHATFTINGSEVRTTETCPGTKTHVQSYSATNDALVLFLRNDVGRIVTYDYAREP